MPNYPLFVYGTLHPDRAPAELAADVRRFVLIGEGYLRGDLREIGGYPAVLLGRRTGTRVAGTVFVVPKDAGLWARLDAYEGFDPENPAASLYLRRLRRVTFKDGTRRMCWVYLYREGGSGEADPPLREG